MVNRYWKRPTHPLYKDVIQGTGGIAGGRFTTDASDTTPYDYNSVLLGTEGGITLVTEGGSDDVAIAT